MKKTIFAIILCIGCVTSSIAQSNLNDYKYVIVPNKYDFLKEANMYQLNALTKFLFNKYGFTAIMEDESFTEELLKNKCLALTSNIIETSNLFKTKFQVELKNCLGKVVYLTEVGETREKEYAKAYNFALRNAFNSFESVNYSYQPNETILAMGSTTNASGQEEVEKLKEEIMVLKQEKEKETQVSAAAIVEAETSVKENSVPKEVVVASVGTPVISTTIDKPESKQTIEEEEPQEQVEDSGMLYAQAIDGGFQLVDSSPKVVYKIMKSSLDNTFFVEGLQAILVKKDSNWVLEYYEGNVLKKKTLNIKF